MAEIPRDMAAHNRAFVEDFRTNGAPEGRALLLLTTTGADPAVHVELGAESYDATAVVLTGDEREIPVVELVHG